MTVKKSSTVPAARAKKRRRTLKPVKQSPPLTAEQNIKKLAKSTIPATFVKKHDEHWNHQDWLDFLNYIHAKGYTPICDDQVGLILEACKTKYLADHGQQPS